MADLTQEDNNKKILCDRLDKAEQHDIFRKVIRQLEAKGFDCRIVVKPNGHSQCVARRLKAGT